MTHTYSVTELEGNMNVALNCEEYQTTKTKIHFLPLKIFEVLTGPHIVPKQYPHHLFWWPHVPLNVTTHKTKQPKPNWNWMNRTVLKTKARRVNSQNIGDLFPYNIYQKEAKKRRIVMWRCLFNPYSIKYKPFQRRRLQCFHQMRNSQTVINEHNVKTVYINPLSAVNA